MESLQERLDNLRLSKPQPGHKISMVWDWSMDLAQLQLDILEVGYDKEDTDNSIDSDPHTPTAL